MPAFPPGFNRRKPIYAGTSRPASTLTDFPMLLKIVGDAQIGAELTTRKLAIAGTDGTTLLPYGSQYFNVSGDLADLTLSVKLTLSGSLQQGDLLGYLNYTNSATDQENRVNVPNSAYKLFMPLNEDPSGSAPQSLDWTANANHGTSAGGMGSGQLVPGQVAYALDFDGSNDSVNVAHSSSLASPSGPLSVECWFNLDSIGGFTALVAKGADGGPREYVINLLNSSSVIHYGITGLNSNLDQTLQVGAWYHMAAVRDTVANVGKTYLNGVLQPTALISGSAVGTGPLRIGDYFAQGFSRVNGRVDEVRVAAAIRSADWWAYQYQNGANNPSTFTLGAEESVPKFPGSGVFSRGGLIGSMVRGGLTADFSSTRLTGRFARRD